MSMFSFDFPPKLKRTKKSEYKYYVNSCKEYVIMEMKQIQKKLKLAIQTNARVCM